MLIKSLYIQLSTRNDMIVHLLSVVKLKICDFEQSKMDKIYEHT